MEESPEIPCGECGNKQLSCSHVVDGKLYCWTCFQKDYPNVEKCRHVGCDIWSDKLTDKFCAKHRAERLAEMNKPIVSNPTEDTRIID